MIKAPEMRESDLQEQVLTAAHYLGWTLRYHTFDSRKSAAGFPDLVLCRPPRVLFVELKSEQGKLTSDQERWAVGLRACPGVEFFIWRPSNWPQVVQTLT